MNETQQVRRATVEDLPELRVLWTKAKLNAAALEKRLTEFQIIESNGLVACIAIQVSEQQGFIHSEGVANFTQRDQFVPVLWNRIQTLARNHGLHRLWIDEPDPAWIQFGFKPATPAQLKKLPSVFGPGREWGVVQLKDETIATLSLEQEFELFTQAQKQSTEQILRQAKNFKRIAYALLWLAVAGVIALIFFAFRHPVDPRRLTKPSTNASGTNRFAQP